MQKYMAMALLSGLFVGVVIADDLHWINAVLAMALYATACALANIHIKEGSKDD